MAFVKRETNDNSINIFSIGGDREGALTTIEGFYLGARKLTTKIGEKVAHFFLNGTEVSGVWGRSVLDKKLSDETAGTMLQVNYLGLKQGKNKGMRPYHNFEVLHDPEAGSVSPTSHVLPGEAIFSGVEAPIPEQKSTRLSQFIRR